MIDYILDCLPGKWTGSINKQVRRDVRQHLRENLTAKQFRYPLYQRFLRGFFSIATFGWFLGLYVVLSFLFALAIALGEFAPTWLLKYFDAVAISADKDFLRSVSGYFITAQVGVLSVLTIAIGLIGVIAQRENFSTDVKIYYQESLAFSVVASSIALLAVLCVQFFWPIWPIQTLLFWLELDIKPLVFETGLLSLHLVWLLLNIVGFAQFSLLTLGFVQRANREFLRKSYTANIVQELIMTDSFRTKLYTSAVSEELEDSNEHSSSDSGADDHKRCYVTELSSTFRQPMVLHNVRIKWMLCAVKRWKKRSMKSKKFRSDKESLQNLEIKFTSLMQIDAQLHKKENWCQRCGGEPLNRLEKAILRCAFSFQRFDEKKINILSAPDQIIEDLAAKVSAQIERRATVTFEEALHEMLDYHRFLFTLNASHKLDGTMQPRYAWSVPHEKWISCYTYLFERAATDIPDESRYLKSLATVPLELLSNKNGQGYPPEVITNVFSIMLIMMNRLEAWVTKRKMLTTPEYQPSQPHLLLSASDARAYEDILPNLIDAWEGLLRKTSSLYRWHKSGENDEMKRWSAFQESWPFLWQHLVITAYCLAVAVWKEDEEGASWFGKALIRWPTGIPGHDSFLRRHNVSPDIIGLDWQEISSRTKKLQFEQSKLTPDEIFASVFHSAHDHALCLTAGLFLFWTMQNKQTSDIGSRTAWDILRQDGGESDHVRTTDIGHFSFESLFLVVLSLKIFDNEGIDGDHLNRLDKLVRSLDGLTEKLPVVPGQVYISSKSCLLKEIQTPLLALLAAKISQEAQENDTKVTQRIAEMAGNGDLLEDGDKSTQRVGKELRSIRVALGENTESLLHGISALGLAANAQEAVSRLHKMIGDTERLINSRGESFEEGDSAN